MAFLTVTPLSRLLKGSFASLLTPPFLFLLLSLLQSFIALKVSHLASEPAT